MTREDAAAFLRQLRPEIRQPEIDQGLDLAMTATDGFAVGGYVVTWDPGTGFETWSSYQPGVFPVSGGLAEEMHWATIRARGQAWPPQASGGSGASADLVSEQLSDVRKAIMSFRCGRQDRLGVEQAAALSVALAYPRVARYAWRQMSSRHRRAHFNLWHDLTPLARRGFAAAPAALLAFTSLQRGNEEVAVAALKRSIADQPGYPPANLLLRAVFSPLPLAVYRARLLLQPGAQGLATGPELE